MTPGEIHGTIEQICDGYDAHRQNLIITRGSDRETKPFTLTFDPQVCSYADMMEILEEVRDRFPQWTIEGAWKQ